MVGLPSAHVYHAVVYLYGGKFVPFVVCQLLPGNFQQSYIFAGDHNRPSQAVGCLQIVSVLTVQVERFISKQKDKGIWYSYTTTLRR